MNIKRNKAFMQSGEDIRFQIIDNGDAFCDTEWGSRDRPLYAPSYTFLYYTISGEAHIRTAQEHLVLKAGTLYLIPAGFPHTCWCDDKMRQLYFHVKLLNAAGVDLFRSVPCILQASLGDVHMEQLLSLYNSASVTDHLYLESLVKRDAFAMLDQNGITLEMPTYSDCVVRAIRYIEQHLSASLTVKAVAEACFISPNTLVRKFKREMAVPLGQYIDNLVLFKAEQLLLNTNLSLLQISEQLGFYDQFYFSRPFKDYFSYPPLQYRKNHRFTES